MPDNDHPDQRSRWDVLTQTGAGTPMGDLLRRYWWPVAGISELAAKPTRAVRLLGEDLVLYRNLSGTYGLIDRHCRHRRADLMHGFPEACGLRCAYHGWLFDQTGRCLAQPYEDQANPDAQLNDQIRITAYPVRAHGGLLWVYLGPQPAPLVPDWEFFSWQNGFRQIVISEVPCNWFQAQENSIDPVHFEWTHANWDVRAAGRTGPYIPTHLRIDFEEFPYGFQYKRIRADTDQTDRLWRIGRVCLWPNGLFTGNHVEFRVPVDDRTMLSVTWHFSRVPQGREPYAQDENSIPTWHGPVKDAHGDWIASHVMNQDFLMWCGQGAVAERGKEYLATSDRGVVLIRNRFMADLAALADGKDPKAIIRDPAANRSVPLPVAQREELINGMTLADHLKDPPARAQLGRYIFQAGQPKEVREAYMAAMGINDADIAAPSGPVDFIKAREGAR